MLDHPLHGSEHSRRAPAPCGLAYVLDPSLAQPVTAQLQTSQQGGGSPEEGNDAPSSSSLQEDRQPEPASDRDESEHVPDSDQNESVDDGSQLDPVQPAKVLSLNIGGNTQHS